MSSIALPATFPVQSCDFVLAANQRGNAAPFGGSEQTIDLLNDRWLCSVDLAADLAPAGAALEAFIAAMRGRVNTVSLYHFVRPAPRGTARGTLALAASAAQGAAIIQVTGCSPSNGTFLAGDMFGVGGLLVMVATDTAAVSGVATIALANRLRVAQSSGASVTWNAPTAPFKLLSGGPVRYTGYRYDPITLEFGEHIA